MMPFHRFQKDSVKQFRLTGDSDFELICKRHSKEFLADILGGVHFNSGWLSLPIDIANLMSIPHWVNFKLLEQGQHFFEKNLRAIMSSLGLAALPYCYAHANGAHVLLASTRLKNDTDRRLMETATFLLDVCSFGSFRENGQALSAIFKVRYIHHMIRQHLMRNEWNVELYGLPVNQMDMAGTNLAFSLITIRSLRRLGVSVSREEAEAYIHLWNVISSLLGLKSPLLPQDSRHAHWLCRIIAEEEIKSSEPGIILTRSLIESIGSQPDLKSLHALIEPAMAFLLGKDISRILNLRELPLPFSGATAGALLRLGEYLQSNWYISHDPVLQMRQQLKFSHH